MSGLKFQVEVFWVVTPCIVVLGYERFGGPCCFRLQDEVSGMGERCCSGALQEIGEKVSTLPGLVTMYFRLSGSHTCSI